jgi:hypothetical protein
MKAVQLVRVVGLFGVVGSLTACPTAPPVINPASGSQPCPYAVTMTDATPNTTIHYSYNTPVSIASPIYTTPLSIDSQATVYAFATAPSMGATPCGRRPGSPSSGSDGCGRRARPSCGR